MPPKTTRRQLLERLGLVPLVAVLAATALAPVFLQVETSQRFTIVLERDVPSEQHEAELDRVAEDMVLMLQVESGIADIDLRRDRPPFGSW